MEPNQLETGDIVKAIVTSEARKLSKEDLKKWALNLVVFVSPTMIIFFELMAQGVEFSKAWPVAAFGLYQALADLFKKWKNEIITVK